MHIKPFLYISAFLLLLANCKKKEDFVNPYSEHTTPALYNDAPLLNKLPTDNFAYLQNKVFGPTCANSGCHDGAFEPDFRTISSSYNTTVYQPVLTNDQAGSFVYRVDPNSSLTSLLHERLITALPNTSGIMPAVSNANYEANKSSYIASIKNWIDNGAKNMFGDLPEAGNPHPVINGMQAFADGNTSTAFTRPPGSGVTPIAISQGNVDIWFNITDDITLPNNYNLLEAKISEEMYDFDSIVPVTISSNAPINALDFSNNSVDFHHKLDFDASSYPQGTILYVRVYAQDENHTNPVESPNEGSAKQVLFLFSLYIN